MSFDLPDVIKDPDNLEHWQGCDTLLVSIVAGVAIFLTVQLCSVLAKYHYHGAILGVELLVLCLTFLPTAGFSAITIYFLRTDETSAIKFFPLWYLLATGCVYYGNCFLSMRIESVLAAILFAVTSGFAIYFAGKNREAKAFRIATVALLPYGIILTQSLSPAGRLLFNSVYGSSSETFLCFIALQTIGTGLMFRFRSKSELTRIYFVFMLPLVLYIIQKPVASSFGF